MSVASTNVPIRTTKPSTISCWVITSNSTRSNPRFSSSARKRTNAVHSGVGPVAEKPQNRRKMGRSAKASSSFTSDRSCQIASSIALNRLKGGNQLRLAVLRRSQQTRGRSSSGLSALTYCPEATRGRSRCRRSQLLLPDPTTWHSCLLQPEGREPLQHRVAPNDFACRSHKSV
jgi:hypothetical protein